MDLSLFYGKIRQQEKALKDAFPIIASQETSSGGKAGVLVEVARGIAARFIVQGLARIASDEEVLQFREAESAAKRAADDALEATKATAVTVTAAAVQRIQEKLREKEMVKE